MKFGLNIKRKGNIFQDSQNEQVLPDKKRNALDKKTMDIITQAIEEDSDIFDYDKAYDSIQASKKKLASSDKKEARYIHGLIKASNKRKIDLEIAQEKKIQREREAEGLLFKDKEKFVTQAYLDKQEELRRLEEEERQREAIEKKDLTGFYRQILNEKVF